MMLEFDFEKNSSKIMELKKVIEEKKDMKGALIPVLHDAQRIFGYIPKEVQVIISEGLKKPIAEIYGVVTFYSQFTLIPKGKYNIGVCMGTACYVKDSQKILNQIIRELGIEVGETTKDGLFSLEATRCIGACGLAPVIMVNEDVYGKFDASEVSEMLKKYK
ncbi:MAG: NAD(P)H-dependent oxidoreductase subunit E [Bacillota bacterium]|nr:NAD(P)H-dependent oxidoreductase subunit E [Bacillota bacterium]